MSELKRKTDIEEQNWDDAIPDDEEERPSPYEKAYRDGSAVNECWAEE